MNVSSEARDDTWERLAGRAIVLAGEHDLEHLGHDRERTGRPWLWNQRSTRLARFFHETRSIAVELERSLDTQSGLHSQTLDKAIQTLERSAFRVMVFGDFSSGKST